MARNPQSFKARVRAGLAPYARALNLAGSYRGNIDGFNGQEIFGWVVRNRDNSGGLTVGLFLAQGLVATTTANAFRADVRDAGVGDGQAGFAFPITREILEAAEKGGGAVQVRVLSQPEHLLGRITLPAAGDSLLNPDSPMIDGCRRLLFGDLELLQKLSKQLDETPNVGTPPPLTVHAPLFSTEKMIPGDETPDGERLPAYLEYVRYRSRQDINFDTQVNADERDQYLDFYLKAYGVHRGKMRAPLSRKLIEHLNEPLVMGGQKFTLSRYMWWRLLASPPMLNGLNLNSLDGFDAIAYWWAWQEADVLNVEDCLVPLRVIERMRSIRNERRTEAMPLTIFMEHLHQKNQQYHFLDMGSTEARMLFALCLLVSSVRRPDVLRYLHPATVKRLLAAGESGEPSVFTQFVSLLLPHGGIAEVTRERLAGVLFLQGYHLDRQTFTSIAPDGNRLHAATLPAVTGKPVDVQVIGPFKKASGLGMATHQTGKVLSQTSLQTNLVDFGLDNPASEGFSKVNDLGEFRPAKVNVIHLNAESLPLVHAYGPDVLSGAYNIGYFYWELDSPALVHYLALNLLDEIWVSADYGVSIYQPETNIPVTNVGMCYEELPPIDRPAARRKLNDRCDFAGDEFVVFCAFDSYSFAQRKNPLAVIAAFRRAFEDVPNARLLVKTQNRDFVVDPVQHRMWAKIDAAIERDPRILLINETLSYDELVRLKAASDCYISLHRSEGWGFGMIEAMNLKVPVVCTGYSGNMDFCSEDTAWLVDYTEVTLDRDDYIFVRRGQKWADPDVDHAARQLRAVYDDPAARAAKVEAAFQNVQQNFSAKAIAKRYETRLREILAQRQG